MEKEIKLVSYDANYQELTITIDGVEQKSTDFRQSGRKTFLFDDFVIKFDTWDDSFQKELRLWKGVDEEDKQYFAGILKTGLTPEKISEAMGYPYYAVQERVFTDYNLLDRTEEQLLTYSQLRDKYQVWDTRLKGTHYNEISHNVTIDVNGMIKFFDYESNGFGD